MNRSKKIRTPLNKKDIAQLKSGDKVLLSGIIYTARDQAHLRLTEMIKRGKKIPLTLAGQVFYYCGPTPPGKRIIGSCGPTTSGRMDAFTDDLLKRGLSGMIGKGRRSKFVRKSIKKNSSVYFLAPAGAGAFLSECVKKCRVIAFRDLGPEAIYELEVSDMPLIVGIDSRGKDLYSKLT